jgi:uncharacterized protein (TIGR03437 family)
MLPAKSSFACVSWMFASGVLLVCAVFPFVSQAVAQPKRITQRRLPLARSKQKRPKPSQGNQLPAARLAAIERELTHAPLRYDAPDEAARFYLQKRLPSGVAELPVERYFSARAQADALPQYATVTKSLRPSRTELRRRAEATEPAAWTALGPGNIGGRTRALLVHPTQSQTMYAAGVAGGVWRSENGGMSWHPLNDLLPNLAVSVLVFDPQNSSVLYAGTGEGMFNQDAVRGAGIFKTLDGGANWVRLPSTATTDFHYVNDLVVSPAHSQRLYAATRTGVWRSLDGGGAWTRVLAANAAGGCLDLAIRTDQTGDFLFAACGNLAQATVYRNTDAAGAGNWTPVLTEAGMGRTTLAVAPANQNIVYALAASVVPGSYQHGLHAVFRSTAGGAEGTWTAQVRNTDATKLNTLLLSNPLAAASSECGLGPNTFSNQGWYDNVIAVDPLDANRVWAGGIDLFRSDDGGRTWGLASFWWAEKTSPRYAHADQHVLVFHPSYNGTSNQTLYVGNDGGLFRTDNARAAVSTAVPCNPTPAAVSWTSLNRQYGVTQFYHGAVTSDGKTFLGGTQDNGTVLGTEAEGPEGWREIFGGDGGYVAVEPGNPLTAYVSSLAALLRKSTDGGKTFFNASFGLDLQRANSVFVPPFLMEASAPQRLWFGGSGVWRSINGGANWQNFNNQAYNISALAVAPTNPGAVLAGSATGDLFRLRAEFDYEETPSWLNEKFRDGYISSITFDPFNATVAYATCSTFGGTHVWRTENGGVTWVDSDGFGAGRLPDLPVHCLVVDPNNPARLYIGTDLGVFVSLDRGTTWLVESSGFPNTVVEALTIQTVNGTTSLYAFTHGRGVWRVVLNQTGCTYTLTPHTINFDAQGGSGNLHIAGAGGCLWSASSNVDWLRITSDASGNGGGTLSFSVAPHTDPRARNGVIALGGRSLLVRQAGLVDTTPPTLNITQPTRQGWLTTANARVELGGTVSNEVLNSGYGVTIEWDGGPAQQARLVNAPTGELFWSYPTTLRQGTTVYTVTARDLAGNQARANITLVYAPNTVLLDFAGREFSGFGGDGGPATSAVFSNLSGLTFDGAGNLYVVDRFNQRIRKINTAGLVSTVAGNGTDGFSGDGGPATAAQLSYPYKVAADQAGNLYIDDPNNQRIRKVAPNGIITTLVGTGQAGFSGDGGPATQATLNGPPDVELDQAGNLLIADNYRIRRVNLSTGIITTIAGNGQNVSRGDGGPATAASFFAGPADLAVDRAGNIYALEHFRVRKISPNGIITTVAGIGEDGQSEDGVLATQAKISPLCIAVDAAGNLLIGERFSDRIRRVEPSGLLTTVAANVSAEQLALNSLGEYFFTNRTKVQRLVPANADRLAPVVAITVPTSTGFHSTTSQLVEVRGTARDNIGLQQLFWRTDRGERGQFDLSGAWQLRFNLAPGLNRLSVTAIDLTGNTNTAVLTLQYDPGPYVLQIAGTGAAGFAGETSFGAGAQLYRPENVLPDGAGGLYIADTGNHRIRRLTREGVLNTVAGNGQIGAAGDGGPATAAQLNAPAGLVLDQTGNLYIADTHNHRIRKVAPTGLISTLAGTGEAGFSGDGGSALAARLNLPNALALDAAGHLLLADAGNHRIRRVNLGNGVITTVAGAGFGFGGDGGPATAALLYFPTGLAVDRSGGFYLADTGNHRIRRVSANGIISTVAGTGAAGYSGDDGPAAAAQLNAPGNLALDVVGNLYFADQLNHRIRKIAPNGSMSRVVGTDNIGTGIIEGAAPNLPLYQPAGVALDAAGNLFVANTYNNCILKLAPYRTLAQLSAASFVGPATAANALVAAFGTNLALNTQAATTTPLPNTLGGTSVRIRDSRGVERFAPLFFVSAGQVNYLIPAGLALGPATVTITNAQGISASGFLQIERVAPALFTANSSGQGVPAAVLLRIKSDGTQSFEPVAVLDGATNRFVPRPIEAGAASDQLFLILFGTGIRGRSSVAAVVATIGELNAEVSFAGAQGSLTGLDQINLTLPRALVGRGEVSVRLIVDGQAANPVRIAVR